jgi:t-SNARE complex subunit (syntaxin)
MDREIDRQNAMLDVIETKVDKAQAHLDNINVKLKNTVEKVMKGDTFLVNCVLFCIVLCLVSFIGSYFIPELN